MDNLKLITHLRRCHYQLLEEWVRQAGLYYLASQGHTHESTNGIIPMRVLSNCALEKELELRKMDLDSTERDINELEEEIQRIYDEEDI